MDLRPLSGITAAPPSRCRDGASRLLFRPPAAFVRAAARTLLFLTLGLVCAGADGVPLPLETNVKAAMIYNFTHFISWERESRNPITICVLGEPAMVTAIREVASRKDRDRQQVLAQSIVENQSVAGCSVVFVPRRAGRRGATGVKSRSRSPRAHGRRFQTLRGAGWHDGILSRKGPGAICHQHGHCPPVRTIGQFETPLLGGGNWQIKREAKTKS